MGLSGYNLQGLPHFLQSSETVKLANVNETFKNMPGRYHKQKQEIKWIYWMTESGSMINYKAPKKRFEFLLEEYVFFHLLFSS